MHERAYGEHIMGLGLGLVLLTMFMWWRDVIREAEYQGHHTPIVQIGMRYGMMLFIASEVMFFVAFFWAFFDLPSSQLVVSGRQKVLSHSTHLTCH